MPAHTIQNTELQNVESKRIYLTQHEIDQLVESAKHIGRYGSRDALLITMAYNHGLRVTELIDLKWNDINWQSAHIHIDRIKDSNESVQPINGSELRQLRALRKESESAFIFTTERGGPMTRDNVNKMLKKAGENAGLGRVHPHMLRHSCGYNLVNKGVEVRVIQDYLGHKNVQNTVRYTKLNASKFKGIEKLF